MEYLALIVVGVVSIAVCGLTVQMLRWRERAWDRKEHAWETERRDLLNRIMYLTEKPWDGPQIEYAAQVEQPEPLLMYPDMDVLD